MRKAAARHILVETKEQCEELMSQIKNGSEFVEVAKQHSMCPSGEQGGGLGEFSPGQMVPEFDKVVFSESIGEVHGPIETQFGFHIIEITSRSE